MTFACDADGRLSTALSIHAAPRRGRKGTEVGELGGYSRNRNAPVRSRKRAGWKLRAPRWDFRFLVLFVAFAMLVVSTQASPLPQDDERDEKTSTGLKTSTETETVTKTTSGKPTAEPTDEATKTSTTAGSKITNGLEVDSGAPININNVKPFDTNLGNFKDYRCFDFFEQFLADPKFQECLPLSTLIHNSNSFFSALKKGLVTITTILDQTCNVDLASCSALMSSYARALKRPENCGVDFEARAPVVTAAYASFVSYEPIYSAGCLKSDTGGYCFADAATYSNKSGNYFLYSVPLDRDLPSTLPDCSTCTKRTMQIFEAVAATGNKSTPLYHRYEKAAGQLQAKCGEGFVAVNVTGQSIAAGRGVGWGAWGTVGLAAVVVGLFEVF